jgi:hypothetical protein
MSDQEFDAELFGPVSSEIFDVNWLHDPKTGIWRAPLPRESERDQLRRVYHFLGGDDPALFDRVYPKLWRLDRRPQSSPSLFVAVLDTGYLAGHPLLADFIEEARDFTSEGVEDRIGHGTGCALSARLHLGLRRCSRLLIGKVFPEDRRHVASNLIQGIEWAASYADKTGLVVQIILRLGIYHRRLLGLKACDGTCDVCKAAARAVENNPLVWIDVAPGNRPGQTACPAMAAIRARREAKAAASTTNTERFASQGPRDYRDAGVGTHVIGRSSLYYSLWRDTVTLYPPGLYYQTLDPRMVVGIEAARQYWAEPFIAMRGSWSIMHVDDRRIEVPHRMGAVAEGEDASRGVDLRYGCDAHGLFFEMPGLPGFVVRGDTTGGIHAQLPDAMTRYLADHDELPELVSRQAKRLTDLLGNSEGARGVALVLHGRR